jgi:hypothetical protein
MPHHRAQRISKCIGAFGLFDPRGQQLYNVLALQRRSALVSERMAFPVGFAAELFDDVLGFIDRNAIEV